MNDAEQICYAQAHMGKKFKNLNPDSFNRVRPVFEISSRPEIARSGGGFHSGDRVVMTEKGRVNAALCGDRTEGVVQGVLLDGAQLKVNGLVYAAGLWRKAQ